VRTTVGREIGGGDPIIRIALARTRREGSLHPISYFADAARSQSGAIDTIRRPDACAGRCLAPRTVEGTP
jgi:hypothetical protein